MSYADLLRDPRWQKKRLEVLNRAEFTCEQCEDSDSTLHVHHRYYVRGRKPWEYSDDALQCLCETCHKRVTEELAELQRLAGEAWSSDRQMAIGYLRVRHHISIDNWDASLRLTSAELAMGAADAVDLPCRRVIDLAQSLNGDVTVTHLEALTKALKAEGGAA